MKHRRRTSAPLAWWPAMFVLIGAADTASVGQLPGGDAPLGPQRRIDPPAGSGAMAPRLTATRGGVLLTWLEPATADDEDDDDHRAGGNAMRLRFSRFSDGAWSEPRTIIERDDFFANWADVPGIASLDDGALLAWWLQKSSAGTYNYDVVLARSTDDGETWTTLGRAHEDASATEHGFVSAVAEGGGVRLFWLDGRETGEVDDAAGAGHGQGHEHGHAGGDMQLRTTLVTDRVAPSEPLDTRVCECCQTAAAMTANGPIVAYRDRDEGEVRDIAVVRRDDDASWTEPALVRADGWGIAACPVNGPAMAAEGERVAVAWYTGANFRPCVYAAFSTNAGAMFSEPMTIDAEDALGRVDLALARDGSAIVAWLAADAYGGVIRLRRISPDGTMSDAFDVARTSPDRRSGFPRLALLDDATALLVWTHAERPPRLRAAATSLVTATVNPSNRESERDVKPQQ